MPASIAGFIIRPAWFAVVPPRVESGFVTREETHLRRTSSITWYDWRSEITIRKTVDHPEGVILVPVLVPVTQHLTSTSTHAQHTTNAYLPTTYT